MKLLNRWFTRFLIGVENGVENDPKAWIVREKDKRDEPTPYDDFPNPAASPVKLFLSAGAPKAGKLSTVQIPNQGKETLIDNVSFDGAALARAEWTNHRLMFVTPILKEDIHLSGISTIKIRLSCNKPAANLSVWMVSLPWNEPKPITNNIITRGWADPQNYKSIAKSSPLKPGKFYDITFDLQPDDQVIPAGQQIGLMIFSSDRECTLWPTPGTELTVDLDATSIVLPVVGGADALQY
jgi:X-Pro dipeptidyl-peptidase